VGWLEIERADDRRGIDDHGIQSFTHTTPYFHFCLVFTYAIMRVQFAIQPFFFFIHLFAGRSSSQCGNRTDMYEFSYPIFKREIHDIGGTVNICVIHLGSFFFIKRNHRSRMNYCIYALHCFIK